MYIILELQTYNDGTVGTLINSYADKNEAESQYHRVLMAAAISDVPLHTCFMLTPDGYTIKSECYRHEVEETQDEGQVDGSL